MLKTLWLSIVVRDRHGKTLSRINQRSKSFLRAYNELVAVMMDSGVAVNITDTGGVVRAITNDGHGFWIDSNAGIVTFGIRVGTGNTAVAIDDFALDTPIVEGAGAGQMNHLATTTAVAVVAAPICSFVISRQINNNSGGGITVREAGLYSHLDNVGPFYGCLARDVLTPQLVPNGGTITINWTIRVTE